MVSNGAAELEKLIHSLEFENQQYVKEIEKETDLIAAVEAQMEETRQGTVQLQREIAQMDEDTKRYYKQFTHNRDNIESMKKTLSVLGEQEEPLTSKLKNLMQKGVDERKERLKTMEHYQHIWQEYEVEYEKDPLAKNLVEQEKLRIESEENLKNSEKKVSDLKKALEDIKLADGEDTFRPYHDINQFMIKIAQFKTESNTKENEVTELRKESSELQKQIADLQQDIKVKEEEIQRKQEEEKQERKRQEEERKKKEAEEQARKEKEAEDERRKQVETERARQKEIQERQAEERRLHIERSQIRNPTPMSPAPLRVLSNPGHVSQAQPRMPPRLVVPSMQQSTAVPQIQMSPRFTMSSDGSPLLKQVQVQQLNRKMQFPALAMPASPQITQKRPVQQQAPLAPRLQVPSLLPPRPPRLMTAPAPQATVPRSPAVPSLTVPRLTAPTLQSPSKIPVRRSPQKKPPTRFEGFNQRFAIPTRPEIPQLRPPSQVPRPAQGLIEQHQGTYGQRPQFSTAVSTLSQPISTGASVVARGQQGAGVQQTAQTLLASGGYQPMQATYGQRPQLSTAGSSLSQPVSSSASVVQAWGQHGAVSPQTAQRLVASAAYQPMQNEFEMRTPGRPETPEFLSPEDFMTPGRTTSNSLPSTPKTGTPGTPNSGADSPFDLDKHLSMMQDLSSKSPGSDFSYASRRMFKEMVDEDERPTNAQQGGVREFPEASSFFSFLGGSEDPRGTPQTSAAAKDLFGGFESPASDQSAGGSPAKPMGFSFGDSDNGQGGGGGSSMFSMFGGGDGQNDQGEQETAGGGSDGFSFSFGGGGDSGSNAGGFTNLFG